MKILIIDFAGRNKIVDSDFIPRIGDRVDMFYEPSPTVNCVLCWPSLGRLRELKIDVHVDAIVTVK